VTHQDEFAIVGSQTIFSGALLRLRTDEVRMGAQTVTRETVDHPGAVAVVALDEDGC
jgi:hypothetical protein